MNLAALFSPIVTFLQSSFTYMSKLDGKTGLSLDDLYVVIGWVQQAQKTFTGATSNELKIAMVKGAIAETFGSKVPTYVLDVLVWLAFQIAKRKGLV